MKQRVFSAFIYNLNSKHYEAMMEWNAPNFEKRMFEQITREMFFIVGDKGCDASNLRCFIFYDKSASDVDALTRGKFSYLHMVMLDDVTVSAITKHDSYDYSQIHMTIKINNGKGYKFYRRMYIAK